MKPVRLAPLRRLFTVELPRFPSNYETQGVFHRYHLCSLQAKQCRSRAARFTRRTIDEFLSAYAHAIVQESSSESGLRRRKRRGVSGLGLKGPVPRENRLPSCFARTADKMNGHTAWHGMRETSGWRGGREHMDTAEPFFESRRQDDEKLHLHDW